MKRSIVALLLFGVLVLPRLAGAQTDVVQYYHLDGTGSVRMVTDAAGQIVAEYDFLPFGELWGTPAAPNTRQFASKERDQATGFDYFGARYYASQIGRFTTVDPGHVGGDIFNPESWNGYSYALNNPLRFVDPLGTRPCEITLRGADAVAAGVEDGGTVQGECVEGTNPVSRRSSLAGAFSDIVDIFTGTAVVGAPESGAADRWAPQEPTLNPYLVAGAAIILSKRLPPGGIAAESTALLTQAAMTVGNKGAIAASRDSALAVAEQWVGIGAKLIKSRSGKVVGKISADEQRIYRTTSMGKAQPYINLENKATGGNLHVRW